MKKSVLKYLLKKRNEPVPVQVVADKPKKKIVRLRIKLWHIITGVIMIAGGVALYFQLKTETKSAHDKYYDENFDSGSLKGPIIHVDTNTSDSFEYDKTFNSPIFFDSIVIGKNIYKNTKDSAPIIKGILIKDLDKKSNIIINAGAFSISVSPQQLYQEFNFFDIAISSIDGNFEKQEPQICPNNFLKFGAIDNRVYIAASFKDLQNLQTFAVINYNRWEVYFPNLLNYSATDTSLVIRDKQNYVALSITYAENENAINVRGYLISPTNCFVMTDRSASCPVRDSAQKWKLEVEKEIAEFTNYQK
jgi:hypothetical protein